MGEFWTVLLTAVGLVLVIEGLFYAAAPEAMQRMMARIIQASPAMLRQAGVVAVALGVLIVWLMRGL